MKRSIAKPMTKEQIIAKLKADGIVIVGPQEFGGEWDNGYRVVGKSEDGTYVAVAIGCEWQYYSFTPEQIKEKINGPKGWSGKYQEKK